MSQHFAPPAPPVENPFAKYPDWLLADTIGDLDVQGDTIADRLKLAKAEVDRRHKRSLDGQRFAVAKSVEAIKRVDSDGMKKKFGQAWWDGWCKPGTRTKWTITALAPPEVGTPT